MMSINFHWHFGKGQQTSTTYCVSLVNYKLALSSKRALGCLDKILLTYNGLFDFSFHFFSFLFFSFMIAFYIFFIYSLRLKSHRCKVSQNKRFSHSTFCEVYG